MVRWCWVNFQCWGVLLIWMIVEQGPTALTVGACGVVWTFFPSSIISPILTEILSQRAVKPKITDDCWLSVPDQCHLIYLLKCVAGLLFHRLCLLIFIKFWEAYYFISSPLYCIFVCFVFILSRTPVFVLYMKISHYLTYIIVIKYHFLVYSL